MATPPPSDAPPPWARYAATLAGGAALAVLGLRPLLRDVQFPRAALGLFGLVCTAAMLFALHDLAARRGPRLPAGIRAPLAVLWVCVVLSWTTSIQQMHSATCILEFLAWTVLFVSAIRCVQQPWWRAAFPVLVITGSVLIAVLAVVQRFYLLDALRAHPEAGTLDPLRLASNRVYGTFLSPGVYGAYLALLIPWQAGLMDAARTAARRWVIPLVLMLSLNVVALVLTRSRAGWIATVIGLVLYVRITRPGRVRLVWLLPLVCAGVLLGAAWPGLLALDTFRARLSYWQGTVSMIRLRPLVGVGLGAWGDAYPTVFVPGGAPTQVAHNDWLQWFAETGAIGGAAFVVLALMVLRLGTRAWRHARSDDELRKNAGVWCGVLAVYVSACFDYPFQEPPVAWLVAGAMGLLVGMGMATAGAVPLRDRAWGRTLAVLVLVPVAFTIAYRFQRGRDAWDEASAAAQHLDMEACEAACGRVRAWAPLDPEPHGLLGTMYLRKGMAGDHAREVYAYAAAASAGAVVRAPWSPWQADRAGIAHWRLAEHTGDAAARADAVDYFRRAAAHFPAHPGFQARLAGVLRAVNDPDAPVVMAEARAAQAAWRDTPDISGPSPLGRDLDPW